MTVAVVSVASPERAGHLDRQHRMLAQLGREDLLTVVGWLGKDPPTPGMFTSSRVIEVVHVPPGVDGLRVAAGRNAAARAAIDRGAELLLFLDADCLAGPDLIARYERAALDHPDAVLAGPVTYLTDTQRPEHVHELSALTRPHPARPSPAAGEDRVAGASEYDLFWSLSFAVTPRTWRRVGGFCEDYEGYGAEDTDFAHRARERGVRLVWVGGAHAYHQWHPTTTPPWQHVDDILRNGAVFADRWGRWPMTGWLEAFAEAGAIRFADDRWVRV